MEENKNKEQQNQFQMGISPEVAMPAPQIKSRVIMAPEHAKRLLQALQSNVYNYEQTFGKIKMAEEQQDRTIAPFGTPKGEA